MMRAPLLPAAALGMLALTSVAQPLAAFECVAPPEAIRLGTGLPRTADAIRLSEPLVIVAIGSSSTEGVGASHRALAYPARLAKELRSRGLAPKLRVFNRGIGGETAAEMLSRFDRDVIIHRPQLVIWQSGSNSVLRGVPVDTYAATVREGIARLKAAGADIILMNAQYAPVVTARPAHRRILDATRRIALELKVGLFHRFAVMKGWIASGRAEVHDVIASDRLHMNDTGYGCLAHLLADGIMAATRTAPADPIRPAAKAIPDVAAR